MKNVSRLIAASVVFTSSLLCAGAFAQSVPSTSPNNVPPPPGINDPGVKAVAPPAAPAAPAPSSTTQSPPTFSLPPMRSGDSTLGRGGPIPEVSVRQEGDNTVQEYRRSGRLYMVVVTPKHGLTQTYMLDPQGRVIDEHGQRIGTTTMYNILQWGNKKPATAASTDAPADTDSQ